MRSFSGVGTCFLGMVPFIERLLTHFPGLGEKRCSRVFFLQFRHRFAVIDASEDKACNTLLPKQHKRTVYTYLSTPWQRSVRRELEGDGVQATCQNDTHGISIDDLLNIESHNRLLTTKEFAAIFIGLRPPMYLALSSPLLSGGDAAHTLKMIRGSEWTMRMHDVPLVVLKLVAGGRKVPPALPLFFF